MNAIRPLHRHSPAAGKRRGHASPFSPAPPPCLLFPLHRCPISFLLVFSSPSRCLSQRFFGPALFFFFFFFSLPPPKPLPPAPSLRHALLLACCSSHARCSPLCPIRWRGRCRLVPLRGGRGWAPPRLGRRRAPRFFLPLFPSVRLGSTRQRDAATFAGTADTSPPATSHLPCPFCANATWTAHSVIALHRCGRGAYRSPQSRDATCKWMLQRSDAAYRATPSSGVGKTPRTVGVRSAAVPSRLRLPPARGGLRARGAGRGQGRPLCAPGAVGRETFPWRPEATRRKRSKKFALTCGTSLRAERERRGRSPPWQARWRGAPRRSPWRRRSLQRRVKTTFAWPFASVR